MRAESLVLKNAQDHPLAVARDKKAAVTVTATVLIKDTMRVTGPLSECEVLALKLHQRKGAPDVGFFKLCYG